MPKYVVSGTIEVPVYTCVESDCEAEAEAEALTRPVTRFGFVFQDTHWVLEMDARSLVEIKETAEDKADE